MEIIAVR